MGATCCKPVSSVTAVDETHTKPGKNDTAPPEENTSSVKDVLQKPTKTASARYSCKALHVTAVASLKKRLANSVIYAPTKTTKTARKTTTPAPILEDSAKQDEPALPEKAAVETTVAEETKEELPKDEMNAASAELVETDASPKQEVKELPNQDDATRDPQVQDETAEDPEKVQANETPAKEAMKESPTEICCKPTKEAAPKAPSSKPAKAKKGTVGKKIAEGWSASLSKLAKGLQRKPRNRSTTKLTSIPEASKGNETKETSQPNNDDVQEAPASPKKEEQLETSKFQAISEKEDDPDTPTSTIESEIQPDA